MGADQEPAGRLVRMGGDAADRAALRSVTHAHHPVTGAQTLTLPVVLRYAGRGHRPGRGLDDGPEGGRVSVGLLVQPRAVLLDVQRDHVRRPRQVSAVAEVGGADDGPC